MAQIEEEKKIVDKEREEMLANFEKHKELERQQQERIRKVCTRTQCTLHDPNTYHVICMYLMGQY